MSDGDNQLPNALVAAGTKVFVVRSASLIKRGLALAGSLLPGAAATHHSLGLALYKKGDVDGAIAEYREAIRLKPDYAEAHKSLGAALKRRADQAEHAQRFVSRFNQLAGLRQGRSAAAYRILGVAPVNKDDRDGAIAEYRTTTRLRPDDADAHWELGSLLWDSGDLHGAIAEFRRSMRLQPDFGEGHYVLGTALEENADADGAIEEFRAAIPLMPNDPLPHYHLGIALCGKGELGGAIEEFRTAIRLDPDYTQAHFRLAVALEMKGDRLAALDEIQIAREQSPNDPSIAETHEQISRKTGGHG